VINKNNLAYILLVLTTLFWSGNFIVGKAASTYEIPPFSLNFFRWLFAGLILFPFTIREILKKKNYIFNNIGFFIVLGITSITIFNSAVYYSLYYMQVISGVLMISTIPVWIMFISSILGIEKTNKFQILGVILSLLGVIFIITKSDLNLIINLAFNKGDLIMASGMFAWALYSALLKKKTYKISQITLLEVVIITGLIFLTPIYILEMNFGNQIIIGKPFVLTLSYVVIFPGLASFFFWIKGIGIIGANRAGVFLHLMPVFGSFMAIIFFDEKFMFYHIWGAIFIIAGITLSNKKKLNA
jgi:drug/metabolite transporter (DMT)-like permease|tara:strand:- start:3531 stop:4430 length:900 start_codon:yes stop_codon:yes gene_type:complete